METFFFDWWWRSHQSLARKGLRIFRFCAMPWKDEREPTIKYCLGGQIDVVQKFITIQNFGHNWWWANGIRVEYFHRIHHIAALQQSPRVPVKNERRARRICRTDHLQSMFSDISWGSEDNEQECELSAQLVSIYARRFSPGRWSFFGPGSEKKWYSTHGSRPQGGWDRVAELMMIKFSESGHPVFRSKVHCPEDRSKAKVQGN